MNALHIDKKMFVIENSVKILLFTLILMPSKSFLVYIINHVVF